MKNKRNLRSRSRSQEKSNKDRANKESIIIIHSKQKSRCLPGKIQSIQCEVYNGLTNFSLRSKVHEKLDKSATREKNEQTLALNNRVLHNKDEFVLQKTIEAIEDPNVEKVEIRLESYDFFKREREHINAIFSPGFRNSKENTKKIEDTVKKDGYSIDDDELLGILFKN